MSMLNSASLLRRLLPVLGLAGLAIGGIHAAPQSPARDRHVVLVSLDGFTAEAMKDPRLPAPTLRRLMREGTSAAALRIVNPALTWPNHTTMVTGVQPARHGVLYNGLLVRPPGAPPRVEPWRDKREMVRAPTVYDAAFGAGLTTAQVDWVAIQNPGTMTWAFPERPSLDEPLVREMIERGLITEDEVTNFGVGSSSAWRDQMWTMAASHVIREHRPNLLLYHLLALDSAQHRTGPGTPEAYTAMAFVDGQLGRLMEAVERSLDRARTTVLVVSDHGFRSASRTIRPNTLLRQMGLITGTGLQTTCAAYVVSWSGTATLFVTDPARRGELVPTLKAALAGVEGVERVMEPDEFATLGWPHPGDSDQMGELVLVAREGYHFSGASDEGAIVVPASPTYQGHHGVLAAEPIMDALFVAWGAEVAAGRRLDEVRSLDIAPTIAEWLGVPFGPVEGRSLAATLR
jgi:predicted AlkP superfamily pyrophosphatase or phosphodiesterase